MLFAFVLGSCKKAEKNSPEIDFTYSSINGIIPDTVVFNATANYTNSIQWDFGDGQVGAGVNVQHVYTHMGYYLVKATAIGDDGFKVRSKDVNVSPYTKLRITRASVTVPPLKPDGSTWDGEPDPANNAPDIRLIITDYTGIEIMNDQFVANNSTNAVFIYPQPAVVNSLENSFTVKVYDYDGPSTIELIGSHSFRPTDYMTDTTASFPLHFSKNNGLGLSVGVNVAWGN